MTDDKKESIEHLLRAWGEKPYRVEQVNHGIYRELVSHFSGITSLPIDLREKLEKEKIAFSVIRPVKSIRSADGNTEKTLFETEDKKRIESVLMRHIGRKTVCVSSQIGCPAGCVFCATGKMGITRNLTAREIVEQVLFWNRILKEEWVKETGEKWKPTNPPHGVRVRNIVFMGMGEPLLNYENVLSAVKTFNDPKKFNIGVRHITISTVGVIPGIERLTEENLPVHLALSLHAATNDLRSELVPMNKAFPLRKLMDAVDRFSARSGRRIFYEYVVLDGKNNREEDGEALGKLLSRRLAHVNFIPYNVNPECGKDLRKPDIESIRRMQNILMKYGVPSTVRMTMGDEMAAACGQLANKSDEEDE